MTILLLVFLLIASPAWGFNRAFLSASQIGTSCADLSCTGFDPCQNFETATTGYDNSETWTDSNCAGGNICDEVDTTATVLRGTQELKLFADASANVGIYHTLGSAASEYYYHFEYKTPNETPASDTVISKIHNGASAVGYVYLTTTGKLLVWDSGFNHSATTTDGLSADTKYHIWVHYKAGSGTDSVLSVEFTSATTYAPLGEGDKFKGITTGHDTASIDRVYLWAGVQERTEYFDHVLGRIGATPIGTVCP